MLLTVSTKKINTEPKADNGVVYVLELELEEKKLIKVGVTCRDKVEDRVCEILTSIWKRYRFFPRCYVKRFSTFALPYDIEARIHAELVDYRYETAHVFTGSTEIFLVDLPTVTTLYDSLKA